jgi:hypothetical protein
MAASSTKSTRINMKYLVDITSTVRNDVIRTEEFATKEQANMYVDGYNCKFGERPRTYFAVHRSMVTTPFGRVAKMNTAFGNPKGDPQSIDWDRIRNQCKNIFDEYIELMDALGLADKKGLGTFKLIHEAMYKNIGFTRPADVEAVRDALCDIQVFDMGAQHLMGYDGDRDMDDVVDGVMSRFVKSDADKAATIAIHAAKGVTKVYFEGEYPEMVMKSFEDQPDAPRGKFLKSSTYKNTVFRPA